MFMLAAASLIGLNTSASYVGPTLGSAAGAALITEFGFSALGWSAVAFLALAAVLIEFIKRAERVC